MDLCAEGIDIVSAKERFMNNETVYLKHLLKFPYNQVFSNACAMIEEGRLEEAFETLHLFKGMTGNLSLNKLNSKVCIVVEQLRAKQKPTAQSIQNMKDEYDYVVGVIMQIGLTGEPVF